MTHKIISINRLRIAVTFLQGTFHPKYSAAICFELSLFDISVELSPLAVKSMFWLSSEPIRVQEITYPDLVVARTDNIAVLRWLDWIFLAGYLPSLSLNYDGMSKDMEKRLPQLYDIKMKISYDLGFIAIGVSMVT